MRNATQRLILIGILLIDLNSFAQDINHLSSVIKQLNLEESKIKKDLVVSKIRPNNPEETMVVIPEIVDEGEQYFELNSYILIIDTETGKIKQQYFESAKTNDWLSDAVRLTEIKIDTAPYMVSENKRAFGIRVYYYGSSHPNPYSNETISLFIAKEDTLKKILNNYSVMTYGGEWDTNCNGEFIGEKKILIMSKEKTNGNFDILVKNKITETTNYIDENNDCEATEKVTRAKTILSFVNGEYK